MKKVLASVLSILGGLVAFSASNQCILVVMDEPEAPKSLIK